MAFSAAEIRNFGSVGGIVRKIRVISFVIVAILSRSLGEAFFPSGIMRVRHCSMGLRSKSGLRADDPNSDDGICEFLCNREF